MKYILSLFILFVACQTPQPKEENHLSSQALEAAKRSIDSIHLLTQKAAAKELTLGAIEKKVEQLQNDVKKYSSEFTKSDSAEFLKYDHKKQEETMDWMSKNGY